MKQLDLEWEFVADTVMGGMSTGKVEAQNIAGRDAVRLTGQVSLENNGGFIQMAADLRADGSAVDASDWTGITLDLIGDRADYEFRLRTDQLQRPWQSFRKAFRSPVEWTTIRFPFADFESHKTEVMFDPARLRRIGILAIGEEMNADIAVANAAFY